MEENLGLTLLMEELKTKTEDYYVRNRGEITGTHIHCLFPEHDDRSPSMSYYWAGHVYHCFSCGRSADIFTLAHLFEGKPLAGREFIEDNVFYLAELYGLEYKHLQKDLTPEELERQSYFRAMKIFAEYVTNHMNLEYLEKRGIKQETAKALLIGSVTSYDDCVQYMVSQGVHTTTMESIGISKFKVNENKLILIIKDEYGRAVSFVSREMKFEKKELIKEFPGTESILLDKTIPEEKYKEQLEEVTGMSFSLVNRYLSTPKYINGDSSPIFNKSRTFFGWSDIRKKKFRNTSTLVIVEGYLDFVTAYQSGIGNVVALGSASFTDEQISIIERSPEIKSVAIALDSDKTGIERTKSILERLLKIKTTKIYKFAQYKDSSKDLDEAINSDKSIISTDMIFDLIDMFEFELKVIKEEQGNSFDQDIVFDKFVGLIAKEFEPKVRAKMARALAKILSDYDYTAIIDQVKYLTDGKEDIYNKTIINRAEMAMKSIKKNPKEAAKAVATLRNDLESVDKDFGKVLTNVFDASYDYFELTESKKEVKEMFTINFGIPWFDDLNIQPGNTFVISSLANTGKSTIFQHLVRSVLDKSRGNKAHIFFATTDDPGPKVYANLIASISGLPREYCTNPLYHKIYGYNMNPEDKTVILMKQTYDACRDIIRHLIKSKQLVLLDVANKIDNWTNLADTMREIAEAPELDGYYKILILDSANKVVVDGITDENQRASYLSENIKKQSETYGFLTFVNFELNKMANNAKLSQFSLSGSRRMFYDCDVLGFVYNPMRNLQGNTQLYWVKKTKGKPETREPILVTIQEKSKAGNNERNNKPYFYKLNSVSNQLTPIIPGTPEHNTYDDIWNNEFEGPNAKYGTSDIKKKF
ncbi:MAG: toprim domain-containing protein [Paraclostridium sp.]